MAQLRVIHGDQAGQPVNLDRPTVVLGRHPECEIVVSSGSVSRRHAQLTQRGGVYFLEDLRSRNGTFVNGAPITEPTRLDDGDEIRICDFVAQFINDEAGATISSGWGSGISAIFDDDDNQRTHSSIRGRLGISSDLAWQNRSATAGEKLQAFVELSHNLAKSISLDDVLPPVLDSLFKIFMQAETGFIVFVQEDGSLLPVATRCRNEVDGSVRISRGIVQHVLSTREAILSADAADDSRFALTESIAQLQIRSFICAPLVTPEGDLLGAVQIDTRDPRREFNEKDLEIMLAVASQAAVSIQNAQLHDEALRQRALQRDLELARQVQRGLLPQRRPICDGYTFFDYYESAQHVGGDYFDYRELPQDRLAVVIGDVSGHDVGAALLMTKLAAEARAYLATIPDPATVLTRLNELLCDDGIDDRFVTMALLVLDLHTGTMAIGNAGHLNPIHRNSHGAVQELSEEIKGLPLGIVPGVSYRQQEWTIQLGDIVILVTDGISEAMNPNDEQYGFQRLHAAIAAPCDSLAEVSSRVVAEVRRFRGVCPQSDDICLVGIQRC